MPPRDTKKRARASSPASPAAITPVLTEGPQGWVTVDVGGSVFRTMAATLCRHSDYFRGMLGHEPDDGVYRVDRDADTFGYLLSYMRAGAIEMPWADTALCRRILVEADFFGIVGLLEQQKVAWMHKNYCNLGAEPGSAHSSMSDDEVIKKFDTFYPTLQEALSDGALVEPRILKTMPTQHDVRFNGKYSYDQAGKKDWSRRPEIRQAFCLALVEDAAGHHLEPLVPNDTNGGAILASRAYHSFGKGSQHRSWTLVPKAEILAAPRNMSVKYYDDESEEVVEGDVHFVRVRHSADEPITSIEPLVAHSERYQGGDEDSEDREVHADAVLNQLLKRSANNQLMTLHRCEDFSNFRGVP